MDELEEYSDNNVFRDMFVEDDENYTEEDCDQDFEELTIELCEEDYKDDYDAQPKFKISDDVQKYMNETDLTFDEAVNVLCINYDEEYDY
ncbi:hypothetical protein JMF89_04070 [Clostridiaceae bacterium UIB06]|uniref:Uncharacterized protein n=1 Tax=Clostridium thailandense TaxID=2794346 RepID=A0A949WPQ9_9CLOT|nr:hypothetical protein [Clostridium thailandense]MBV7271640.1 hypothetical protein [Clostridium thailandense]MCH5136390.1 hypothetical protein [Clostridiaceae bacterium UIB06]